MFTCAHSAQRLHLGDFILSLSLSLLSLSLSLTHTHTLTQTPSVPAFSSPISFSLTRFISNTLTDTFSLLLLSGCCKSRLMQCHRFAFVWTLHCSDILRQLWHCVSCQTFWLVTTRKSHLCCEHFIHQVMKKIVDLLLVHFLADQCFPCRVKTSFHCSTPSFVLLCCLPTLLLLLRHAS